MSVRLTFDSGGLKSSVKCSFHLSFWLDIVSESLLCKFTQLKICEYETVFSAPKLYNLHPAEQAWSAGWMCWLSKIIFICWKIVSLVFFLWEYDKLWKIILRSSFVIYQIFDQFFLWKLSKQSGLDDLWINKLSKKLHVDSWEGQSSISRQDLLPQILVCFCNRQLHSRLKACS